jgi:hypothetical protein
MTMDCPVEAFLLVDEALVSPRAERIVGRRQTSRAIADRRRESADPTRTLRLDTPIWFWEQPAPAGLRPESPTEFVDPGGIGQSARER